MAAPRRRRKAGPPDLSRAEFEILNVLWKHGRSSVREVHDRVERARGWAYTTTKTIMDRMAAKDLLRRGAFHGITLYEPLISKPAGLARFVEFFARRVLDADTRSVVALFGQSEAVTAKELRELERILAELKKE